MTVSKTLFVLFAVLLPSQYVFGKEDTTCSTSPENEASQDECTSPTNDHVDGLSLLSLRSKVRKGENEIAMGETATSKRTKRKKRTSFVQERSRVSRTRARAGRAQTEERARMTKVKERQSWELKHAALRSEADFAKNEFEKFMDSMKVSTDACSARLMESSKAVHSLHDNVLAFETQVGAENMVLSQEQKNLDAAKDAIATALKSKEKAHAACDKKRRDNELLHAQLVEELEEMEQIADPDKRASMVGRNFTQDALDISTAARAATAPEVLLQTGSSSRQKGSPGTWSKEQCLSFLSWNSKRNARSVRQQLKNQEKGKQDPAATEEPAAPTDDATATPEVADPEAVGGETPHLGDDLQPVDCDKALAELQGKFEDLYETMEGVAVAAQREAKDETCYDGATLAFNLVNGPMTAQRTEATTKIHSAELAVTNLSPLLAELKVQDEEMERSVKQLQSECGDMSKLTPYMTKVRTLILNAAECPGVVSAKLTLPTKTCRKDGSGSCTWKCSEMGWTFGTGGYYGHMSTVEEVPDDSEEDARAFCQLQCVKNPQCVGFTYFKLGHYCNLKQDVIDGSFREEHEDFQLDDPCQACFIQERQALINQNRPAGHPGMSHEEIAEFWTDWDWLDENEAFDYYYEDVQDQVANAIEDGKPESMPEVLDDLTEGAAKSGSIPAEDIKKPATIVPGTDEQKAKEGGPEDGKWQEEWDEKLEGAGGEEVTA